MHPCGGPGTVALPNGRYRAYLNFNEAEHTSARQRVFDVVVRGQRVAERLDVFPTAGRHTAHQIVSPSYDVADGLLRIEFRASVGVPSVAYISVGGRATAGDEFFQRIDSGSVGGDYGL